MNIGDRVRITYGKPPRSPHERWYGKVGTIEELPTGWFQSYTIKTDDGLMGAFAPDEFEAYYGDEPLDRPSGAPNESRLKALEKSSEIDDERILALNARVKELDDTLYAISKVLKERGW